MIYSLRGGHLKWSDGQMFHPITLQVTPPRCPTLTSAHLKAFCGLFNQHEMIPSSKEMCRPASYIYRRLKCSWCSRPWCRRQQVCGHVWFILRLLWATLEEESESRSTNPGESEQIGGQCWWVGEGRQEEGGLAAKSLEIRLQGWWGRVRQGW